MPVLPLTVTQRLIFKYTVNAFPHKSQHYCETIPSADPSGFDVTGTKGLGSAGVSGLSNVFFGKIAPLYKTGETTFDGWELQDRIGTTWVFAASGTTSVTPSGSNSFQQANGMIVVGKDIENHRMPIPIFEGSFGLPSKGTSYAAQPAVSQNIIDYFFAVVATPSADWAWNWKRSRDGGPMQRWLSIVIDSNEKLRRLRHIK